MKAKGTLTDSYQINLDIDGHSYIVDRSIQNGGKDSGTSPHGMLLGSMQVVKLL